MRYTGTSPPSLSPTIPVGHAATEPEDRDECRITLPKIEGVEGVEEKRLKMSRRASKAE